jgi:hypothetical protein
MDIKKDHTIIHVPMYHSERYNYCSEASAQMLLQYYGYFIGQDQIHNDYWTIEEMGPLFDKYNFRLVRIPVKEMETEIIPIFLQNGIPVIVRTSYSTGGGHTVVAVGYRNYGEYIDVNDPDLGVIRWDMNSLDSNITDLYYLEGDNIPEVKPDFLIAAKRSIQKRRDRAKNRRREVVSDSDKPMPVLNAMGKMIDKAKDFRRKY